MFGKEELDEFRKQRRAEAHQYGIDGEVFHKHDAVLDTVATMCHSLRECSQAEDVVTPQMVGVIASMLRVRAKERPDTTELKTIIESIMAIAKKTFGANRRRADHQNSNPQHQFPGTYALDYPVPPEKQTADHARAYGQPSNSYVPASGGMDYGNTTQTWLRGPGVGAPGAYYLPEDSGHLRTHALESHFANNNVPSADYNPTGYGSRYHDAPHVRSDQVPYVAPEYNTGGRQLSLEQKMQAMKLHGTQTNANASHIQLDKSSQYAQIPQRNNSRGQRSFYEQSGDRTNQGPSYSGPPPAAMPAFPFGAMPQSHHQWQPPTSPMQGLPHGNGHFAPQANSGFGYGSSHYASFHHDTVGQARGMRYPAPQTRPFSEQYQKKSMADVNPSRASLPPRRSDSRVSLSASAAHRAPQVHSSPETIHEDYHPEPGILSDYPLFPTINEVPPQQPLLPQGNSTREIPKCKLGQAKDYIRAKKDKKRGTLPYSYLLNDLDKRDHVSFPYPGRTGVWC